MTARAGLRAGWLAATVPAGAVVVGPGVEIAIELASAPAAALVAALARGDVRDMAGEPALWALLDEQGAFGEAPAAPQGTSLAAAIGAARRDAPVAGVIWTAEEALVLPETLDRRTRTRALRAFVAGLRPDGRLQAYALAARGQGVVAGDVPDPLVLRERLAAQPAASAAIAVIDLVGGDRPITVAAEELDRLGASAPHRLGPILRETVHPPAHPGEAWLCVAEIAVGTLAAVGPATERLVQGVGEDEAHARLVAHAEGAERFAAAELSGAEIVRAARGALEGAVDPATLYAGARHDRGAAQEARLWCPVVDRGGRRRWAPAETVHTSVVAPAPSAAVLPWTSSGLAAHTDPAVARRRAFWELVERDAFMWTWIQRVSRERVARHGAPAAAADLAHRLERAGWATHWVNLSLDTVPVVLCCVVHEEQGLSVGAAADDDPATALFRATAEAAVLALRFDAAGAVRPPPGEVRGPRDHLLLHRDPALRAEHGFLYDGGEELELGDIPAGPGGDGDLEGRLDDLGYTPLVADLSLPACRPFHVARALAPGLLPLTFGWGTEPVGMARARRPVDVRGGRVLGRGLGADTLGIMNPHPFP